MAPEVDRARSDGWRLPRGEASLREVHGSIPVPQDAGFWRKLFAFAGPGYLVAVGYMDPGNWATDLAGGAQFGYALLSVVLISNFMAILLQHLSLKLGIVAELWAFMKVRKKWWLGPIVVMLALLGLLIVFTQGSAVAPFIYTLF